MPIFARLTSNPYAVVMNLMDQSKEFILLSIVSSLLIPVIISFFLARRIIRRSVRLSYDRIESGEQGELPLWTYRISVGSWIWRFGFILFAYAWAFLLLNYFHSDIERYLPALKLTDLNAFLSYVTTAILSILGVYLGITTIVVEREVRKRVLSIVDSVEGKIWFVNLGEPVMIRSLTLAIESGEFTIFGFPKYYFLPVRYPQAILLQGDIWKIGEEELREQLLRFEAKSRFVKDRAGKISDKNMVLLMASDKVALADPRSKYLARPQQAQRGLRPLSMCFLCRFNVLKKTLQENVPLRFAEWSLDAFTTDGRRIRFLDTMRIESPRRPTQD